jgi:hypothetical protein
MQRNIDSIRMSEEYHYHREDGTRFTCDGCGGTFQRPLFATVSSSGTVEKYYACPRCMTRVNRGKKQSSMDRESEVSVKDRKISEKSEDNAACNHFVGYLRKREKDMPIPDECLTCSKMVECMLH